MNQQFSFLFLLCFIFWNHTIEAQNLVINPSFENIVACPDALEQIENSLSWTSPTAAKADYFHECDLTNTVGIPGNSLGFQSARTGSAYAGVQVYSTSANVDYREYLQIELIAPLIADSVYQVGMYVSPGDNLDDCFTDAIGAYFSNTLLNENQETVLNVTPVVQNTAGNFLTDKGNWVLISGTFTAIGGETHLIIGNFLTDAQTTEASPCGNNAAAYYYVEDVSVELIPDLSIVGQDFVCVGETITLEAINASISTFQWQADNVPGVVFDSNPVTSVTPLETTTYTVSNGGETASITVTVQTKPEVVLAEDVNICVGETKELDATPMNSTETATFEWIDGSTGATFEAESGGIYWVDVTVNTCTFRDSIELVEVADFNLDLGEDGVFCQGTSIVLDSQPSDIVVPGLEFLWQDGSTDSQLTVSTSGTYSVTISNECFTQSDEIMVETILCDCLVTFPSAFSPNEDGINDSFQPVSNCELGNYKLSIFTRYGNEIFTSNDITNGWDGMIDLKAADLKNYVWVATYQIISGAGESVAPEEVIQKGSVLLLK
ncbi:MAG: T9SS type B sorting domain-containing protein [Chitinophagales bacterium]